MPCSQSEISASPEMAPLSQIAFHICVRTSTLCMLNMWPLITARQSIKAIRATQTSSICIQNNTKGAQWTEDREGKQVGLWWKNLQAGFGQTYQAGKFSSALNVHFFKGLEHFPYIKYILQHLQMWNISIGYCCSYYYLPLCPQILLSYVCRDYF